MGNLKGKCKNPFDLFSAFQMISVTICNYIFILSHEDDILQKKMLDFHKDFKNF